MSLIDDLKKQGEKPVVQTPFNSGGTNNQYSGGNSWPGSTGQQDTGTQQRRNPLLDDLEASGTKPAIDLYQLALEQAELQRRREEEDALREKAQSSVMAYDGTGKVNAWQTALNLAGDAKAYSEVAQASKTEEQKKKEAEERERYLHPKTAEEAKEVYGLNYNVRKSSFLSKLFGHDVYLPEKGTSLAEIHGAEKGASSAEVATAIKDNVTGQVQGVKQKVKDTVQQISSGEGRKTGNPTLDNWGENNRQSAAAARTLAQTYGVSTYSLEGSTTRQNTDSYLERYQGMNFGEGFEARVPLVAGKYVADLANTALLGTDVVRAGAEKLGLDGLSQKLGSIYSIGNFVQNAGSGITSAALSTIRENTNWLGKLVYDIEDTTIEQLLDRAIGAVTGSGGLVPMGARVLGSGAQEAEDRGESLGNQIKTGIARSGVEIGTELLGGVGGSWRGTGYGDAFLNKIDKWIASKTGSELLGTLANAFTGEMLEEMIADVLNPVMDRVLGIGEATGRGQDRTFMQELGDFLADVWGDGQLLYDGLLGGLAGLGGGAVTHTGYTIGARNLSVDVATYKAAERIVGSNALKAKFEELTGDKLSSNQSEALVQAAIYLTNVTESTEGNPGARQVESNLVSGIRTGTEERSARNAVSFTRNSEVADVIDQAFDGLDLSKSARDILVDGYAAGTTSIEDYAIGTREAYRLGAMGMTLEKAIQNSDYAAKLHPVQFRHAWQLGARQTTSETSTADVSTEEGRTTLSAALAMLGDHEKQAAAVYESGQDVSTFAGAMNKAAVLYAANGMDLKAIVQDARDGKTADIVGTLTDAQVDAAIQIGTEIRAERQAEVKASAGKYASIRTQAAQIVAAGGQNLTEINRAISEARSFAKSERQEADRLQKEADDIMSMWELPENGEELWNAATAGAKEHRQNAEKAEETVKELEAKRQEAQSKEPGKRKKGTVRLEGIEQDKLSRKQKNVVAMVQALADAVNIDYVIFNGEANGNQGAYKNGTVYVNINAGATSNRVLAAATLSHELTHYMQEYAPEEYQELKDFIIREVLRKNPGEFRALVKRQTDLEARLTYAEAEDEVIANACQTMLLNSKAITQLARQNMRLAEKVADVLEDITAKIKAAFEDVSIDTVAYKSTVKAIESELDRIQELWDKGIAAATENYNAVQTVKAASEESENAAPESSVKYQKQDDSETRSIKQQIQAHAAELNRKPVVSSVRVSDMPSRDIQKQRKWVEARLRNTGYAVDRKGFGKIEFTPSQINTGLNYLNDSGEIAAFAALPAVIKRGDIIDRHESHKGRQRGSVTIAAPVEINGVRGNMAVALTQTTRTHYHTHRILMPDGSTFIFTNENDAELTPAGELPAKQALIAEPISSTSELSIADVLKNGKAKFQMAENVEATDKLVAVHNKSVSGLRRMLQRGGVPFPSIAIKKAGTSHEGFGDVSIVFPRSSIDPQVNRQNRLYSNDAWTPTEPRTEYDVGDMWRYMKKLRKEIGDRIYDGLKGGSYLEEDEIAKKLMSSNGNIFEALKDITVLKYAYLKSIGKEPTLPEKTTTLDGFGKYKNEQLLAVFDALTDEEIQNMSYDTEETLKKVSDVLNEQFMKQFEGKYDSTKLAALRKMSPFSPEKINPRIIQDAYYRYKDMGISNEIDFYAFDRELRNNDVVNDPGYREWIESRFKDLIVNEGIPNGKDLFTDSGNRRSFKARHVPATLENIVKQMQKENERGNGLFGVNLRGAATKAYSSVEEMRKDSGKLLGTHVSDDVYDSYMQGFYARLHDLTDEAARHTSDWSAQDSAQQILLETLRDATSKAQMGRLLDKESRWIKVTPELKEALWQLKQDVQNMPAPYFEAKPRRIVYPEEALAYILPDNADSDVMKALEDRGYNVMTYKAGDEQDRLQKLNSVEGAQFQSWDSEESVTDRLDREATDRQHNAWAPTFYSKMENTVNEWTNGKGQPLGAKMAAGQVIGWLKGKGVKAEEIRWSGIVPWLEGRKTVTKDELLQVMAENRVQIETKTLEDTVSGSTTYYQGMDPRDGDERRFNSTDELMDYLDELAEDMGIDPANIEIRNMFTGDFLEIYDRSTGEQITAIRIDGPEKVVNTKWSQYATPGGRNYREILFKMPSLHGYTNQAMGVHWGVDDVIAHARVQDMEGAFDERVLFVEEIQSDLHNEGAGKGFMSKEDQEYFRLKRKQQNDSLTAEEQKALSKLTQERFGEYQRRVDAADKKADEDAEWARELAPSLRERLEARGVKGATDDSVFLFLAGINWTPVEVQDPYGFATGPESEAMDAAFAAMTDEEVDRRGEAWRNRNELTDAETLLNTAKRKKPTGAPDVPFAGSSDTYHEYVMKHLLRLAAEGDYDVIAWTTADMQSKRWSDEFAEGYKIEYDQEIPKFMRKYVKQWGGSVGSTVLGILDENNGPVEAWSVKLNDAMKKDVLTKGQPLYQRWDDTTDDTAAEANDRELAYTRLQSENKVLGDTIKALNKTISKRDSTIEKLQTRLHLTKTQETREADARKLARALIRENGSKADVASVTAEIKALGDYILQTETDKVSEEEIKSRARRIAAEILERASEQVTMEDEQLATVRKSIKGKKLTISPDFIGELDGGFDSFRKGVFGKFTLARADSKNIDRAEYTSVGQFYADMQSEYGKAYFPDLANEGEEAQTLASIMQTADPLEINPFEKYMGEATEELANRISMDALSGVLRVNPPTDADKAKARNAALREQIMELKKEQKLADKEAASLYSTIYDLSVALDHAESRYKSLQISGDRRMAQVRAEGAARAVEIKAAERARSAEKIANLKEHYQDMQRNARQRRENTGTRRKIRRLIDELNTRLKSPTERRHIPRELVQQTIDMLRMIDLDNGLSESLTTKLASIRTMYEGYQKDPTYSVVYDDVTAEMLKNLAATVGDTKLLNMSQAQLDAVYDALKSLNHVIHESINVRIGTEERNAYEVAKEMTAETRQIPTAQKSWARRKYLPAHLRADVAFRRFAGFKKNSAWESMCRVLNDGQLRQTELQMRLSLPFADLVKDEKALADFTAVNSLGKIDKSKLVDIGLKDEHGDPILVSHDIMLGIYMDLLNEDNRRHFIRGGKTVPNLADFYSGKGGFGIGTRRAVGISEELSELYGERREAKGANYGDWSDDVQGRIDALTDAGERYADEVKAAIEKNMTDFDRKWVQATQQLMDVDSKRYLNETTMQVYGIEKARVKNYFPITTDPNFLGGTSFESITRDMSLENAGFMKERVPASNPTLALGVAGVVNNQINRVAQYCGLMPAIRNFNKVYNKIGTGYSDSLKNAVNSVFGKEGLQYIENLIADLTGSNRSREDVMGLNHFFAVMRGNLAQSTLTINPRVALAQAASYPTAAAEVGYTPLVKAFFRGGKSGRMISRADTELIAKYSPLLYLRMQGYSSPELGDIKNSKRLSSKVFKKLRWLTGWIQAIDGATVGRLWYAAEYWVQDNKPGLQKGTDAYYEAVAEKFNAIVEKTQPNYTPMQRAAILREPDGLIRTFTMFMTQRLQNFNILYDSACSYQKARADFANNRNGVTKADVAEAKNEMVRAGTSQLAQAAVFTAFKLFADALLHSLNGYRDDDTGELTAESISLQLLDNYMDALAGTFLLGTDLYGIIKAATGFGKWYGLSLSGVDSLDDMLNSLISLVSTDYDMTTESGREKFRKKLWKASKDFSAAFFGTPTGNAEKMYNAVRYYTEDIMNGEFGSFNAGYSVTAKQQKVQDAMAGGVTKQQYLDAMREANTDGNGSVTQDELNTYLDAEIKAGRLTEGQADAIWNSQGWKKTRGEVKSSTKSTTESSSTSDSSTKGSSSSSTKNSSSPVSATPEKKQAAEGYDTFKSAVPIYKATAKAATYSAWETNLKPAGMTLDRFISILSNADLDSNDSLKQDELGTALRAAVMNGEMTFPQAVAVWDAQGWQTSLSAWGSKH